MELKPKSKPASNSVFGMLRKIINKSGKADDADDNAESGAKDKPSFVETLMGFVKTVYMKSPGINNEDTVLAAHERWKEGFMLYLESKAGAGAHVGDYAFKDTCEVCKWIETDGRVRWGKNPVFVTLTQRHPYFHEQVELVLAASKAGDTAKVQKTLDTNYKFGTNQTILLLKQLKTLQKAQAHMS